MSAQQQRFRRARLLLVETQGALFSQFVESWVETGARLSYERPAELFQPDRGIGSAPHVRLKANDLKILLICSLVRHQCQCTRPFVQGRNDAVIFRNGRRIHRTDQDGGNEYDAKMSHSRIHCLRKDWLTIPSI